MGSNGCQPLAEENTCFFKKQFYLNFGKFGDDLVQLVPEVLLGEFHLSHVEGPDPGYLVVLVDYSRCLSLGFRQYDINKVFSRRNDLRFRRLDRSRP